MKGIWNDARLVPDPRAFETASAKLVPACQGKDREEKMGLKKDHILLDLQAYSH